MSFSKADTVISHSQIKMYEACPLSWKLRYVDKVKEEPRTIHLIFGEAMHHVIQTWLRKIYDETVKAANELDLNKMLSSKMAEIIKDEMEVWKKKFDDTKKMFDGEVETDKTKKELQDRLEWLANVEVTNKAETVEFYFDGVKILDYLRKHQNEYFPKKGHRLLGIELKLDTEIHNNVNYLGFIDVIIMDEIKNRVTIIDIKTSTNGWNKYQKKDKTKTDQLLLYKYFFSKGFNVPMENIDVVFLIVKRKLYENTDYYQKRIQLVKPASGSVSINRIKKRMDEFVQTVFDEDGKYNKDIHYPAIKGKNNKHCKYCLYKDRHDLCDPKKRQKGEV